MIKDKFSLRDVSNVKFPSISIGANLGRISFDSQFNLDLFPLSPLLRSLSSHEAPAAGAEEETGVVPGAAVVDGVDGHFLFEEAGDKAYWRDESVDQA